MSNASDPESAASAPHEPDAQEPDWVFRREARSVADGAADLWIPSLLAQGPWDPNHLHGGAVCGALGHAIERCESPVPMRVARMTVEMTRAVPLEPFEVRARVSRAGKRIQGIDAWIEKDGVTLARATALRMRTTDRAAEAAVALDDPVPPRTEQSPDARMTAPVFFPGFIKALEFIRCELPKPGLPGITWTRMTKPLVEGETLTPFVTLATLADFASGAGNPLDYRRFTSINPDLSLHVVREPRGEWIGLRGFTQLEPDGIGQSHCTLYDEEGVVGRSLVSLLVEKRAE